MSLSDPQKRILIDLVNRGRGVQWEPPDIGTRLAAKTLAKKGYLLAVHGVSKTRPPRYVLTEAGWAKGQDLRG